jgi:fluoroacetyl-CoA thioesterase
MANHGPRAFGRPAFVRFANTVCAGHARRNGDRLHGGFELACTQAIMDYVDWPNEQSLGTHVSFSHLAATPPGMTLTIRGEVIAVEGRRVRFRVEAWDGLDKITEGEHERAIITPEKFHERLNDKKRRAGL